MEGAGGGNVQCSVMFRTGMGKTDRMNLCARLSLGVPSLAIGFNGSVCQFVFYGLYAI